MYACGLRISEASSLEISNIKSDQMVLRVIGKGNKERLVPLPLPIYLQLREFWLLHRHPCWLFPNKRRTNHLVPNVLYRSFNDACSQAGLSPDLSPHSLRHSYATRLMESGVDVSIIQLLLGHSSLKSTTIYIHLSKTNQAHIRVVLDDIMADL
jgi:site-specific recombinase XerD